MGYIPCIPFRSLWRVRVWWWGIDVHGVWYSMPLFTFLLTLLYIKVCKVRRMANNKDKNIPHLDF